MDGSSTASDPASQDAKTAGLSAERDRLLREVLYLRGGHMVGGGGDDLDAAARIALRHQDELESLRADLARTTGLLRDLKSSHADDVEIKLEASRSHNEALGQEIYALSARLVAAEARVAEIAAEAAEAHSIIAELSARLAGANARVVELEASTSWQITAPVRVVTGRLAKLR